MHTETHTTTHKPRRHATGARAASPQTLIQMAFDRCDGDRKEAAEAIIELAESNAALAEYLVALGARTAVGNLICSDRAKIYNDDPAADVTRPRMAPPSVESLEAARSRVRGRAARNVRMMLDARLSNGKRMAAAGHADLSNEIAVYEPQAHDMLSKVAYFRAIAAKLPKGKLVGDVFTNEALTAMFEAARVRKDNEKAA